MGDSSDGGGGADDYIYRGESSTPQDGQEWNPPAPPPAGPPEAVPFPTSPPPGFPPQQPPVGPPIAGIPAVAANKKKRWPWIVAAVVVLCGLPLGGCVALIGFGVNELNERADDIEGTVEDFFETLGADSQTSTSSLVDGQPPCMATEALVSIVSEMGTTVTWSAESTAFVERSGNSTLSSNADPETLFIDGRPEESAAVVNGRVETDGGTREVQVLLSRPASQWRICTIIAR